MRTLIIHPFKKVKFFSKLFTKEVEFNLRDLIMQGYPFQNKKIPLTLFILHIQTFYTIILKSKNRKY